MPSARDPLKESYKTSRVYKHRYKDRPIPKRCSVIKKNGEQCGNWAYPGMKCCKVHGGASARSRIKHGATSKSLQTNIMYYLNYLSSKEKKAVAGAEYDNNEVVNNQMKLTDVLTARALEYLGELQKKLKVVEAELKDTVDTGYTLDAKLKHKNELEKSILNAHKVIQQHQKTAADLLKTRQSLQHDIDAGKALDKMAASLEENRVEMLAECISSFMKAGVIDNLDQLKLLVEADTQEVIDVVEYEYEQD